MFFDIRDSDGTPLSRYKLIYKTRISLDLGAVASNNSVIFLYNQLDTFMASMALGMLSLMSSSSNVLSTLSGVYRDTFGRIFNIVPPAAVLSAALILYIAWVVYDRRANTRNIAEDGTRLALAFGLAVITLVLARDPFAPMNTALNLIPNVAMELLTGSQETSIPQYMMDEVVRPITQTLMYGQPLDASCSAEWSDAMDRGNAPSCAPALDEAPTGAFLAALFLLIYYTVLLVFSGLMFVMFVYHVSLAAWHWFTLMYVTAKSMFDTKAFTGPTEQVRVALGHTLCAIAVSTFAGLGPVLSITVVNVFIQDNPAAASFLYIITTIALMMISRQAVGWLARKTGAVHGDSTSILNRIVSPPAMIGADAKRRRRGMAATTAGGISRIAGAVPMVPGALALSAGAAAVENRLRGGMTSSAGTDGEGSETVVKMSPQDQDQVDAAASPVSVSSVQNARRPRSVEIRGGDVMLSSSENLGVAAITQATGGVSGAPGVAQGATLPGAPSVDGSAAGSIPASAGTDTVPAAGDVLRTDEGRHRASPVTVEQAASVPASPLGGTPRLADQVHVAPDPEPAVSAPAPTAAPATTDPHESIHAAMTARSRRATSGLNFGSPAAETSAPTDQSTTQVDAAMSPAVARVRDFVPSARPIAPLSNEVTGVSATARAVEQATRAGRSAVLRDRMKYVSKARGQAVLPVMSDDDPGMEIYMYNDGTRNIVEGARGESIFGDRI